MLRTIKMRLYFIVAAYFGFWARMVLARWKPRIIVITGSSGKTTLLQLTEAQLGEAAIYSHHANSAIGIPFHILGLGTNITSRLQWIVQLIQAPFRIFRALPPQRLYIVEADCDRPGEGKFLSKLLKPEVTMWVSIYRTHSMNFDRLIQSGKFSRHEDAIAYEFGYFAEAAQKMLIINADQQEQLDQLRRVRTGLSTQEASMQKITKFGILPDKTEFEINGRKLYIAGIHPKETGISLQMVIGLMDYLGEELDKHFKNLVMPPSRSSIFAGKNDTTIIDSSYNTGLGAMTAMLRLFKAYPSEHKWVIVGDILEQGSLEKEEHEKLASAIDEVGAERVILLGPRTRAHTLPLLQKTLSVPLESFDSPKEVLDYILAHSKGGETFFFKGGRFLEGVIEQLLANSADADKLARREPNWVKVRQKWGLPR